MISRDDRIGERYFKFAKTQAGQYEIHVKLGAAPLGDSPYTIHVKGGPAVNYVRANASSRVGLTTIVYEGETRDRLEQLDRSVVKLQAGRNRHLRSRDEGAD